MEERYYYTDDTTWKIWMLYYDLDGRIIGVGVHRFVYEHKSSAVRRARQLWGNNNPRVKWVVSKTNPWTEGDLE